MARTSTKPMSSAASPPVSHNLVGQRLGRKGQETRERILAAMLKLVDDTDGPAVTLTAVAKEASVGMTTLYLYFPDMADLLLAALRCVMASADDAYLYRIRDYWPDETLEEESREFHRAHYRFWRQHRRLMQMRNSFADASDVAVLEYRGKSSEPLLLALIRQMSGDSIETDPACFYLATVALVGIERVATVVNTQHFHMISRTQDVAEADFIDSLICAQATVVALTIRHQRAAKSA